MNTKTAKRIRKETGFVPSATRSYEEKVLGVRNVPFVDEKGMIAHREESVIQVLNSKDSPRARYQAAKTKVGK